MKTPLFQVERSIIFSWVSITSNILGATNKRFGSGIKSLQMTYGQIWRTK